MAEYALTAADIDAGANIGNAVIVEAGGTVAAGEWVYLDAADDNKAKPADNTSAAKATVYGMALNSAADEQPLSVLRAGSIEVGAAVFATVGLVLVISGTAGDMELAEDSVSGDHVTIVGYSTSTHEMMISIVVTAQELTA